MSVRDTEKLRDEHDDVLAETKQLKATQAAEAKQAQSSEVERQSSSHSQGSASWSKAAATSGLRAPVWHPELPTVSIVDLRAALAGGHGSRIPLGDGSPLEAAPADHRMLLGKQFGARMGGYFFESIAQMRPKRQTTGSPSLERHTFGLGYHPSRSESAAGKKMVQYMDRICTVAGAYPTATIARVQQKEPTSSLFAQLYRPAPAEDVESGN